QLSFLVELGKSWKLRNRAKLSSKLGYGHYVRPPALESALNKYGLPSLFQINLDTTYSFGGPLSGLSAELLVIYKGSLETGIDDPGLRLNKVDMMHGNFIVNYSF